MYMFLTIFAVIVCLAALVITLLIAKQETNKANQQREAGDTGHAQLERSQQYEKTSLTENLPLLFAIYGVTFLIALLFILLFLTDWM